MNIVRKYIREQSKQLSPLLKKYFKANRPMKVKVWTKEEVEANRSKAYKYVI